MPAIGIGLIPLLLGAAGATEAGLKLSGAGQPNQEALQRQQQAQLDQAKMDQARTDAEAKRKSILATMANAQEQGGGSLDEKGLTSLASVIAGLPSEASTSVGKGALSSYLGLPGAGTSPTGENMVSATYGLSGGQG